MQISLTIKKEWLLFIPLWILSIVFLILNSILLAGEVNSLDDWKHEAAMINVAVDETPFLGTPVSAIILSSFSLIILLLIIPFYLKLKKFSGLILLSLIFVFLFLMISFALNILPMYNRFYSWKTNDELPANSLLNEKLINSIAGSFITSLVFLPIFAPIFIFGLFVFMKDAFKVDKKAEPEVKRLEVKKPEILSFGLDVQNKSSSENVIENQNNFGFSNNVGSQNNFGFNNNVENQNDFNGVNESDNKQTF